MGFLFFVCFLWAVSNVACQIVSMNSCSIQCSQGDSSFTGTGNLGIPAGRPGKRGPVGPNGPVGQKGEMGTKGDAGSSCVCLDQRELVQKVNELESLITQNMKTFFYTKSLTWQTSKTFCEALGLELCGSSNLCQSTGGGKVLKVDVIPGDHWAPVSDSSNEWVEVGDSLGRTCFVHSQHYGKPAWGTSSSEVPHKGFVYCCISSPPKQTMHYQYTGKTTTYASSKTHCEEQGLRLCYAREVCIGNQPTYGIVKGDHWAAVKDSDNEWVEIGDSAGRTCYIHNDHYNPPPWGIRTDESLVDHTGYVICCSGD